MYVCMLCMLCMLFMYVYVCMYGWMDGWMYVCMYVHKYVCAQMAISLGKLKSCRRDIEALGHMALAAEGVSEE